MNGKIAPLRTSLRDTTCPSVHGITPDIEVYRPELGDGRPLWEVQVSRVVTETVLVRAADGCQALSKAHTLVPPRFEDTCTFEITNMEASA